MTIKACIFDMDGVLIEAKDWHYEALNRALALFGYTISRAEHLTTYDGLPTARKLKMLTAERGLPEALHGFINEMKQAYTMELVHTLCKPTFHHQYALSILRSRGMKLAVASNSIRNTVTVMMEKAHLRQYLDLQLSNEDVENPKPAPDIYTHAIEILGLKPNEVIVIEDNHNGIKAARAAGAHVLEVADTSEVTLDNILARIAELELQQPLQRAKQ